MDVGAAPHATHLTRSLSCGVHRSPHLRTKPGDHALRGLRWASDTHSPLTVPQSTAVRANLTRRFAPSPWGGGAGQSTSRPLSYLSLNRPPKRLKDERSTVFALLVPPLCAVTLVFAPSQHSHFSYIRCDVYGYVLYFFISNFLKHRYTLSLQ